MGLSLVSPEEALKRFTQRFVGPPNSVEALSDLIRAEVHSRQHAPRAATLSRVAQLFAPVVTIEEQRIEDVCARLEREGDIVLAPGGLLYATPTRMVAFKHAARIFSSVPTHSLEVALGCDLVARGATRTVRSVDGLAEMVAKVSGALVTPESWAGLDRTPIADNAFLTTLEQRLEWQALDAGSLEKDGVLEWRTLQLTSDGMRWRRSDDGRLWRARKRFGGYHRAWTASGSPATSPFIELSPDDADRARFALARDIAGAFVLRILRLVEHVILELPAWLPRPEYRWLSLHAEPASDTKSLSWKIDATDEAMVTRLLAERLGLTLEAT